MWRRGILTPLDKYNWKETLPLGIANWVELELGRSGFRTKGRVPENFYFGGNLNHVCEELQ